MQCDTVFTLNNFINTECVDGFYKMLPMKALIERFFCNAVDLFLGVLFAQTL